MIRSIRRALNVYGGIAAIVPKQYLAYNVWVWMEFIVQILSMTVFVYFWRALYANANTLNGLGLAQTINYILLAQILMPLVETRVIFQFGFLVRGGQIAIELLRPLDFQMRFLVETLTGLAIFVVQKIPLVLLAWLLFGLELPVNPIVWLAFAISLILGQTILFLFDWIFACLAFYSTETWGLSVVRIGIATFFSGALVPLAMMPEWLQSLAAAMPFAQTIYVPASLLSGIIPLADVPQVWLVQLAWLAGLGILSRWFFRVAVRQITVQGG